MRPRALDLFCGAGGVSVGLHRAGFDVVGVDLNPKVARSWIRGMQGRGTFICASALDVPLDGFGFIWASPPCQRFSSSTHKANRDNHPDLVDPIRQLCGGAFGLTIRGERGEELALARHRLFESQARPAPTSTARRLSLKRFRQELQIRRKERDEMTNIIEGLKEGGDLRREAAMGFARALVEELGETDPERVARLAVEMADAVLRHLQQAPK